MKEFVVNIPEGYEIDKEKSTFERIIFKKIESTRWRDDEKQLISGCYIENYCKIINTEVPNAPSNYNVFATEKHAKRAIAEARISQIMTNDERFGGVITDEEWAQTETIKNTITRVSDQIYRDKCLWTYNFLAFHTEEQRDLFMEENMDLIKDYFMLD